MPANRRPEPDQPTPGRFPTLTYGYDPETGVHDVRCSCNRKAFCQTTEHLVARRFAQTHTGEHARLRIVNPLEAIADDE